MVFVMAALTPAWAQPPRTPPIVDPGRHVCPEATLPLRIAAVQGRDAEWFDPLEWITMLGIDVADPVLVPDRHGTAIYVFVLVYRSTNPVEIEVSLTPFGADEPTWRHVILPTPPRFGSPLRLDPTYLAVEVDRSAYSTAFPVDGPYRLVARPVRDPESAYVEGFCTAETTSWALVLRR